jgi:predicted nucleic acid-binding Zn ribbon protein
MTALRTFIAATIAFDPMPTYVYKFVDTGETIEVQQAFTDEALTETVHPASGELKAVKKVFTPVGVTFKGGGFYKTDSRSGSSSKSSSTAASSGEGASSGDGASRSAGDGGGSSATRDGGSTSSTPATTPAPAKSSPAASSGDS